MSYENYVSLDHQITPYFMHLTVENVPQSELKGEPVMETLEVVQLRFAGDKEYSPVKRIDEQAYKEGNRVITFAERFSGQYAQFLQGAAQEASGTPLEKLASYGISQAQLSLCRALKIYSIEALYGLEGSNVKNLGMHSNDLKAMARSFMDDRAAGGETQIELARLRQELAEMKAGVIPEKEATAEEITKLASAPSIDAMDETQLKDYIEEKTKVRPKGTPSIDALRSMAKDI